MNRTEVIKSFLRGEASGSTGTLHIGTATCKAEDGSDIALTVLYSYAEPIARRHEHLGMIVICLTSHDYSPTTNKHIGAVRVALASLTRDDGYPREYRGLALDKRVYVGDELDRETMFRWCGLEPFPVRVTRKGHSSFSTVTGQKLDMGGGWA